MMIRFARQICQSLSASAICLVVAKGSGATSTRRLHRGDDGRSQELRAARLPHTSLASRLKKMTEEETDIATRIDRLVDEYRTQCLWFLRRDFYPRTREQQLRVLGYIQRHGDRNAYSKASEARRWLSQKSSEAPVGS